MYSVLKIRGLHFATDTGSHSCRAAGRSSGSRSIIDAIADHAALSPAAAPPHSIGADLRRDWRLAAKAGDLADQIPRSTNRPNVRWPVLKYDSRFPADERHNGHDFRRGRYCLRLVVRNHSQ